MTTTTSMLTSRDDLASPPAVRDSRFVIAAHSSRFVAGLPRVVTCRLRFVIGRPQFVT